MKALFPFCFVLLVIRFQDGGCDGLPPISDETEHPEQEKEDLKDISIEEMPEHKNTIRKHYFYFVDDGKNNQDGIDKIQNQKDGHYLGELGNNFSDPLNEDTLDSLLDANHFNKDSNIDFENENPIDSYDINSKMIGDTEVNENGNNSDGENIDTLLSKLLKGKDINKRKFYFLKKYEGKEGVNNENTEPDSNNPEKVYYYSLTTPENPKNNNDLTSVGNTIKKNNDANDFEVDRTLDFDKNLDDLDRHKTYRTNNLNTEDLGDNSEENMDFLKGNGFSDNCENDNSKSGQNIKGLLPRNGGYEELFYDDDYLNNEKGNDVYKIDAFRNKDENNDDYDDKEKILKDKNEKDEIDDEYENKSENLKKTLQTPENDHFSVLSENDGKMFKSYNDCTKQQPIVNLRFQPEMSNDYGKEKETDDEDIDDYNNGSSKLFNDDGETLDYNRMSPSNDQNQQRNLNDVQKGDYVDEDSKNYKNYGEISDNLYENPNDPSIANEELDKSSDYNILSNKKEIPDKNDGNEFSHQETMYFDDEPEDSSEADENYIGAKNSVQKYEEIENEPDDTNKMPEQNFSVHKENNEPNINEENGDLRDSLDDTQEYEDMEKNFYSIGKDGTLNEKYKNYQNGDEEKDQDSEDNTQILNGENLDFRPETVDYRMSNFDEKFIPKEFIKDTDNNLRNKKTANNGKKYFYITRNFITSPSPNQNLGEYDAADASLKAADNLDGSNDYENDLIHDFDSNHKKNNGRNVGDEYLYSISNFDPELDQYTNSEALDDNNKYTSYRTLPNYGQSIETVNENDDYEDKNGLFKNLGNSDYNSKSDLGGDDQNKNLDNMNNHKQPNNPKDEDKYLTISKNQNEDDSEKNNDDFNSNHNEKYYSDMLQDPDNISFVKRRSFGNNEKETDPSSNFSNKAQNNLNKSGEKSIDEMNDKRYNHVGTLNNGGSKSNFGNIEKEIEKSYIQDKKDKDNKDFDQNKIQNIENEDANAESRSSDIDYDSDDNTENENDGGNSNDNGDHYNNAIDHYNNDEEQNKSGTGYKSSGDSQEEIKKSDLKDENDKTNKDFDQNKIRNNENEDVHVDSRNSDIDYDSADNNKSENDGGNSNDNGDHYNNAMELHNDEEQKKSGAVYKGSGDSQDEIEKSDLKDVNDKANKDFDQNKIRNNKNEDVPVDSRNSDIDYDSDDNNESENDDGNANDNDDHLNNAMEINNDEEKNKSGAGYKSSGDSQEEIEKSDLKDENEKANKDFDQNKIRNNENEDVPVDSRNSDIDYDSDDNSESENDDGNTNDNGDHLNNAMEIRNDEEQNKSGAGYKSSGDSQDEIEKSDLKDENEKANKDFDQNKIHNNGNEDVPVDSRNSDIDYDSDDNNESENDDGNANDNDDHLNNAMEINNDEEQNKSGAGYKSSADSQEEIEQNDLKDENEKANKDFDQNKIRNNENEDVPVDSRNSDIDYDSDDNNESENDGGNANDNGGYFNNDEEQRKSGAGYKSSEVSQEEIEKSDLKDENEKANKEVDQNKLHNNENEDVHVDSRNSDIDYDSDDDNEGENDGGNSNDNDPKNNEAENDEENVNSGVDQNKSDSNENGDENKNTGRNDKNDDSRSGSPDSSGKVYEDDDYYETTNNDIGSNDKNAYNDFDQNKADNEKNGQENEETRNNDIDYNNDDVKQHENDSSNDKEEQNVSDAENNGSKNGQEETENSEIESNNNNLGKDADQNPGDSIKSDDDYGDANYDDYDNGGSKNENKNYDHDGKEEYEFPEDEQNEKSGNSLYSNSDNNQDNSLNRKKEIFETTKMAVVPDSISYYTENIDSGYPGDNHNSEMGKKIYQNDFDPSEKKGSDDNKINNNDSLYHNVDEDDDASESVHENENGTNEDKDENKIAIQSILSERSEIEDEISIINLLLKKLSNGLSKLFVRISDGCCDNNFNVNGINNLKTGQEKSYKSYDLKPRKKLNAYKDLFDNDDFIVNLKQRQTCHLVCDGDCDKNNDKKINDKDNLDAYAETYHPYDISDKYVEIYYPDSFKNIQIYYPDDNLDRHDEKYYPSYDSDLYGEDQYPDDQLDIFFEKYYPTDNIDKYIPNYPKGDTITYFEKYYPDDYPDSFIERFFPNFNENNYIENIGDSKIFDNDGKSEDNSNLQSYSFRQDPYMIVDDRYDVKKPPLNTNLKGVTDGESKKSYEFNDEHTKYPLSNDYSNDFNNDDSDVKENTDANKSKNNEVTDDNIGSESKEFNKNANSNGDDSKEVNNNSDKNNDNNDNTNYDYMENDDINSDDNMNDNYNMNDDQNSNENDNTNDINNVSTSTNVNFNNNDGDQSWTTSTKNKKNNVFWFENHGSENGRQW